MDLAVACASVMNPIQLANPVAAGNMPSCDALHSSYSRRKLLMFPRIPHTYEDIDLPDEYKLAESGRNFLLFNESFPSIPGGLVDNHIMCYGTKKFFKKLVQAKRVHMDGTFKVCPEPFVQLFTICSFHHDDAVNYEDDLNNRLLPRIYCLLSGKSQIVYERLFQLIIDKANHWNYNVAWEQSMSDFEFTIFNALTVKFPNVTPRGCHFHYCQAVFRRIQRNMKVSYAFISRIHLTIIKTLTLNHMSGCIQQFGHRSESGYQKNIRSSIFKT